MVQRVLEPEIMDDRDEAMAYNEMDHGSVNDRFAEDLLAISSLGTDWLDVGTGTALIPIALCKRTDSDIRIMASDASQWMLEIARYNLEIQQCSERVQLHLGDAKQMVFERDFFDTVLSNSLIHHLPTHESFFREIVRVVRPKGVLFLRDLLRPDSEQEIEKLVETYGGSDTCGKQMFRQSLFAALTVEEVQDLTASFGIDPNCVMQTSDRHWTLAARANHDKSCFGSVSLPTS